MVIEEKKNNKIGLGFYCVVINLKEKLTDVLRTLVYEIFLKICYEKGKKVIVFYIFYKICIKFS